MRTDTCAGEPKPFDFKWCERGEYWKSQLYRRYIQSRFEDLIPGDHICYLINSLVGSLITGHLMLDILELAVLHITKRMKEWKGTVAKKFGKIKGDPSFHNLSLPSK